MATVAECEAALHQLARRLSGASPEQRQKAVDRSVSCTIPDLGTTFHGHLRDGDLTGITQAPQPGKADLRLTVSSDDLLALTEGRLNFASAWASGRLKVDASFRDLMRLRSMF